MDLRGHYLPHGWDKQAAEQRLINDHAMDVLNDLADTIRHIRQPIQPDQLSAVSDFLDGIDTLADEDASVPAELREYVHRLTQHARNCVEDYERLGKFELDRAMEQLWVALQAAEARAGDDTKQRWRLVGQDLCAGQRRAAGQRTNAGRQHRGTYPIRRMTLALRGAGLRLRPSPRRRPQ